MRLQIGRTTRYRRALREHLAEPGREIPRLLAALRPGGWLGVMTKRVRDAAAFAGWHYILDPTHVCFFSEHTFRYLANRHGLELELPGADTALMRKPPVDASSRA